jgi:hypothetical protein
MRPTLPELVAAVRRSLGTSKASLDCPCLACAADRLCVAVERGIEEQRRDAAMLVGLADLQRVEAP